MTITDISILCLSVRVVNCLKKANILTLEELCRQTPMNLRNIKYLGETAIRETQ